jgi:CBS domain containing-hemolysin-like protein
MATTQILQLYPLRGVVSYFEPGQELPARLMADSPALLAMTDLRQQVAFTVEPNVPIDQALQRMKTVGVRLLFVVNDEKDILGLITSNDILGEKPLKFHNEQHQRYEEILVRDIMTPHARLEVLNMQDVQRATVGDIVATLRSSGRRHALVVDHDTHTDKSAIRGIFSATQIEIQLGQAIQTTEVATTFAEVEMALNS